MDLTPQSLRSPVSPYGQQAKQSFSSQRPCYPITPQPEAATVGSYPNRGLGLSGCHFPQSRSTIHDMPPSPQPSGSWSHSPVMEHDFPQSSQPPDISSAAYDPFSGFNAAFNTGMPDDSNFVFCQSSPSSNWPSHRSSISSSYTSSETFSHHGSEFMLTPTVKLEDPSDWYSSPGNESALHTSPISHGLSPYSHGVSPVSAPTEDVCRTQPSAGWPRACVASDPSNLRNADDGPMKFHSAPHLPTSNPPKRKRHRTTPEEATHECQTCGKLFKRSYNYKSHMQTHDPDRKYPHPCTSLLGGTPCTKKFQRKTDLDRHRDSVKFHVPRRPALILMACNRYISKHGIIDAPSAGIDSLAETP